MSRPDHLIVIARPDLSVAAIQFVQVGLDFCDWVSRFSASMLLGGVVSPALRRATHFSLIRQREVSKRKTTQGAAPFGFAPVGRGFRQYVLYFRKRERIHALTPAGLISRPPPLHIGTREPKATATANNNGNSNGNSNSSNSSKPQFVGRNSQARLSAAVE